jgi:membrane-associated phospholipid phosphatase
MTTRQTRASRRSAAFLLALAGWAAPVAAQERCAPFPITPAITPAADSLRSPDVEPLEVLGATAATATLFLVDRPVHDFLRRHRSPALDGVAKVFRQLGTAEAFGVASAGVLGAGLVSGDGDVKRAGVRMVASFVVTAGTTTILKHLIGRSRPEARKGAFDFDPFADGQVSLPSGHTAIAFALATSLADDIDEPVATVALYAIAAGTAWSRLNDERHWPSDVLAGALIGTTSAKFVSGRWTVFGIRSPEWIRRDQMRSAGTAAAVCRAP